MHDLALAAKCGDRGCNGLYSGVAAAACAVKKPSPSNNAVRANPAKPAPICQRNSPRDPTHSALAADLGGIEFTVRACHRPAAIVQPLGISLPLAFPRHCSKLRPP